MKGKLVLILALVLVPTLLLAGCGLPSLSLEPLASRLDVVTPLRVRAELTQPASPDAALAQGPADTAAPTSGNVLDALQDTLGDVYHRVNPSVVNIQVRQPFGAGSGEAYSQSVPARPAGWDAVRIEEKAGGT